MAALGITSKLTVPTPSGKRDSRYPDGDDSALVSFATIPSFLDKQEGTPFSVNIRTGYLTEPGSPDATMSVEGSLPTGWSFLTSTLSYDGTGTGLATIRFKANRSGTDVFSNTMVVSSIAEVVSDALAPIIPVGLTAVGGAGNVTLEWDASSDPHDGTSAGSGMDEYDVLLGAVTVHTMAASAGLSPAFTQHIIGASEGSPDSDQTGSNWVLVFGGAGIDSTADQVLTRSAIVSGNAFATTKLISCVGATFAKTGIMIRESTDPGAKYIALYFMANGKLQLRVRDVTGGVSRNLLTQNITLPAWIKLERVGDLWKASYSTDGGPWNEVATYTLSMTAPAEWGSFVTSTSAGTDATGTIQQFHVNNVARPSYVHTTAVGGNYTIKARDAAGTPNVSAASAIVAATPTASAPLIRAYYGHYMRGGNTWSQANWLTQIDNIANESSIRGIIIYKIWKTFETTPGSYNWDFLTAVIGRAQLRNKKVIVRLSDREFGTQNPDDALPLYMDDQNLTYSRSSPGPAAGAALWREAAMTYNINLWKAFLDEFGDAVNADGTPTIAMIRMSESVYGPHSETDYSAAACVAQEIRRMRELRAYAPAIPFLWPTSWLNGDITGVPKIQEYYAAAREVKGVWFSGGADVLTNSTSPGMEVMEGDAAFGGIDHRNTHTCTSNTEYLDWNHGDTVAEAYGKAVTTNKSRIMGWLNQETASQKWTPDILPFIRTNPTITTVPSSLTGLVTTV